MLRNPSIPCSSLIKANNGKAFISYRIYADESTLDEGVFVVVGAGVDVVFGGMGMARGRLWLDVWPAASPSRVFRRRLC